VRGYAVVNDSVTYAEHVQPTTVASTIFGIAPDAAGSHRTRANLQICGRELIHPKHVRPDYVSPYPGLRHGLTARGHEVARRKQRRRRR